MSMIRRDPEAFSLDPIRKGGSIKEPRHLAFIRSLPSVISGQMGCDACHLRMGDPRYRKPTTGKSQKPDDAFTLPMTRDEHEMQHGMSERAFWLMQGVDDPCGLAFQLYQITGDVDAAERLIRAHLRSIGR